LRPRTIARPAAAGALCLAVIAAGADTAPAQSAATTEPSARAAMQPRIAVRHRKLHVRAGHRTAVIGRVLPGVTGVTVSLQIRRGGRWKPITAIAPTPPGATACASGWGAPAAPRSVSGWPAATASRPATASWGA
jgi:hypothetical protein